MVWSLIGCALSCLFLLLDLVLHLWTLFFDFLSLGKQFLLFFLPGLFCDLYLLNFSFNVLRHIRRITLNTQLGAKGCILDFKLLLFVSEGLHLLSELLVVLLREFSGLLELLILLLVLCEHTNKLFLLLNLHLSLCFVGLHLFLELFSLTIYLRSQGFLNVRLFTTLLTQLSSH